VQQRNSLPVLFVSTFLELAGYFMLSPLFVITLKARGHDNWVVGLFSASVWVGVLVATPFTARWVAALGKRRALVTSVAVPLACMVGITLTGHVAIWAPLYFIAGMASSIRWITAEALVTELAPEAKRGRIVGAFSAMVGACFVLGPFLLTLTGTTGLPPFLTALALLALGLCATLLLPELPLKQEDRRGRLGLAGIIGAFKADPIVMAAGFIGGFFESGLASILPLLGLTLGLAVPAAALLVSASGVGSSVLQVPLGMLADRVGARSVFIASGIANTLAALLLTVTGQMTWLVWPIALIWGAAGGAMYTLSMIENGRRHRDLNLVNSTAVLVMSYTLGGMSAPALGGAMLDLFSLPVFALLLAAIGLAGTIALARRDQLTPTHS
jgi:MFS family permease